MTISGKQLCNILSVLSAVAALVLGILIFSKVNKKGWCGEGFEQRVPKSNNMILKATNACVDYITIDSGDQHEFNCGEWAKNNRKNQKCNTNIGLVDCDNASAGFYSPLDCCRAICEKDISALGDNETCFDNSV